MKPKRHTTRRMTRAEVRQVAEAGGVRVCDNCDATKDVGPSGLCPECKLAWESYCGQQLAELFNDRDTRGQA